MFEQISIIGNPENIPSEKDINLAEKLVGFQLPNSYKQFVSQFGTGLLCGLFNIFVPGVKNENINLVDQSKKSHSRLMKGIEHGFWKYAEPKADTEWLKTLKIFGSSDNGDMLSWDVQKIINGEYLIYFLDNEQECVFLAADTLDDFVNVFCVGGNIDKLYPLGNEKKWNLPSTFQSYSSAFPKI
jgi:hypothetical protein